MASELPGTRNAARRGGGSARRVESWTSAYQRLPGIDDEFLDKNGAPKPHWRTFLNALSRIDDEQIERRFASADRHIRDLGVSYRVYGETNERSWPLSHVPLLIPERDWREIVAGITQRAELMERVLTDLYGDAKLVSEGALPAAVVTGSADYMRPMRGVKPPGGKWLRLYAADIGRGPDGRWWVLGDRAQAPSGSGYALENRLVLSRAFPTLYRDMNVQRLAPFFREFRNGLTQAASRSDPRICLLTPGPFSQTYFEQAYLARYLGILLVEGDDLTMRDGEVHVRTIAGLKRADVIWRRVDADWSDPLEANAASRLGVPGLMQAIRNGTVTVANMPGSGLIESRALLGFMPALCRRLLGEDLSMPNIATWWCGQESERKQVLLRLDDLVIAGAFSDSMPGASDPRSVIGADLDKAGASVRLAKGGNGGFGNTHFKGPVNQAPRHANPGLPGEERWLWLRLKLIADVGLIGLPNAGKSTFLSTNSNARPKIADYPFTTLEPHLGVVRADDERNYTVADIPGLVEGAAEGKGLGHQFLRHITRARALVILVELDPVTGVSPAEQQRVLIDELRRYQPDLLDRPRLVVGSKSDMIPDEFLPRTVSAETFDRAELAAQAEADAQAAADDESDEEEFRPDLVISSITGQGITALVGRLATMVDGARTAEPEADGTIVIHRPLPEGFTVEKIGDGEFAVLGKAAERAVALNDLTTDEAADYVQSRLKRIGVDRALAKAGARDGDTVHIAELSFIWYRDQPEFIGQPTSRRRRR